MPKKRAIVYIDGYNWYHAIFKHRPDWKWLNIQRFFEALRPHDEVMTVKLFTAMVMPRNGDSSARVRQETYLKALKTLPKLKIILGKFQERTVTCNGVCRKQYVIYDEKKTDVNIAVEMVSDAVKNQCEAVIVVSGDSDVQPPLEWIKKEYPDKDLMVYVPALPNERAKRRLDYYEEIGIKADFLPLQMIGEHQLKHIIPLGNGGVACRPSEWR